MSRDARHALLLLLGGAVLRVCVDETVLRYVRPGHRWLLVAAGALVLALAVTAILRELRDRSVRRGGPGRSGAGEQGPSDGRAGDGHGHDGHGHDGHEERSPAAWLLLVPVLVIALVPPPALGVDALVRDESLPVRGTDLHPPLPAGTVALALGEVVDRAVWEETRSVAGREVIVTGFLARRHGDVVLARMRISCCAADARASTLRLRGTDLPDPPASGERWLRVRGTVVPGTGTAADRYVPDLLVAESTPVPAPPDPYEY